MMSEYIYESNLTPGYDRAGNRLVEIVRCRDCAYNAKDTDGICYRFDHEHFNQPDGFCAWGERKETCKNEITLEQVEKLLCECSVYTNYDGFTFYSRGISLKKLADKLNQLIR